MQRSASDVEITSETLISIKQESDRWGPGHTSLVFCGAGILVLTGVMAGAHSQVVTVGWIGLLALSVTLSLGGLMGACFAFSERKAEKVRKVFATELDRLETFTSNLATSVTETSNETRLELATVAGAVRLISKRLDEVVVLLAHASLEAPAVAVGQSRPAPRQRRRRNRRETDGQAGATGNVVNMPNAKVYQLGIAEGQRRKRDEEGKKTD